MRHTVSRWTERGALVLIPDHNHIFNAPGIANTATRIPDLNSDPYDAGVEIHSYACGSDWEDHPSFEEQATAIDARAATIDGEYVKYVGCVTEQAQYRDRPFRTRPVLQSLLSRIQPGEHLIVFSLGDIDALTLFGDHPVHVHAVEPKTSFTPEASLNAHSERTARRALEEATLWTGTR